MGGIASRGQLRWSFARWAAVCVPLVLLIGFVSGRSVAAGSDNPWYVALIKPSLTPPDWLFPVAWSVIYVCIGLALATVLNARGARGRGLGVGLLALLLVLLAAWQPLFAGAHRIWASFWLISAIVAIGIATTFAFARVRPTAAWLMVPLLIWTSFAGVLCLRLAQLNPDAERLAPGGRTTQML